MSNLMYTLQTGKSTLLNTQVSIQTVSHNMSNADRAGYARQKAVVQTSPAYRVSAGWIGTGATVEQVVQQRDLYVEQRLLSSASNEAHYEALSSQLRTLSAYMLDDDPSGLNQVLGNFWDSWDRLQETPSGLAERENVAHAAQNVADTLNTTSLNLQRFLDGVDVEIEMLAGSPATDPTDPDTRSKGVIEGLLSEIADLNRQIRLSENPRHHANDLRDKRYEALNELSQYMPIEYTEEKNGFVTVRLTNSNDPPVEIFLVKDEESAQMEYDMSTTPTPTLTVTPAGSTVVQEVDLEGIVGGRLSGLLAGRDDIELAQGRLDDFAREFTGAVNGKLAGEVDPPIFEKNDGTWSSSMAGVWAHYDAKPDPIRALSGLASDMANLSDESITWPDNNRATFSEYLGDLQRELGAKHWDAQVNEEFNQTLKTELLSQQQFVSGVNLDEEMVDLLKFQHIYQSAAKIIQKTDEMLKSVINMV